MEWVIFALAVFIVFGLVLVIVSGNQQDAEQKRDTAAFYDEVEQIVTKARKDAGLK